MVPESNQQYVSKSSPVDCNKWMQGDKNHDYNKWKKSLDIQKGINEPYSSLSVYKSCIVFR